MSFRVRYAASARQDLIRLYRFLLDQGRTTEDLTVAEQALAAIEQAVEGLVRHPFVHRKSADDPFLRELVIPFGRSGYLALFEIEDADTVSILAVRHQREEDWH